MTDARYEDAAFADQPLRIAAEGPEDLEVLSALVQDAVGLVGDVTWMRRRRRAVLLLNRFRWEDRAQADRQSRPFERVRSALVVDDVQSMRAMGLNPGERDMAYAVLSLGWEPGEDGAGTLKITLAGDGEIALEAECLDARLVDLTRPWEARGAPSHDLD